MKHALKLLGLSFLFVPAAFGQLFTEPCVCQIECNGASYQYSNTTVAFCCKQYNELCGEEGSASCAFPDGRVRYCTL